MYYSRNSENVSTVLLRSQEFQECMEFLDACLLVLTITSAIASTSTSTSTSTITITITITKTNTILLSYV